MNRDRPQSREAAYFERLYAANPDPWNFTSSAYEQRKYAATIEVLGGHCFSRGLEIGCSIGVLTKVLARHCTKLLALDVADQALAQARARCAGEQHVAFANMQVPRNWPAGQFDLIIFSEVLYFLDIADIERTAALADASLAPGGVLLLVNYTEDIDEPCSGEEAADSFIRVAVQSNILKRQVKDAAFRIDLLEKKCA